MKNGRGAPKQPFRLLALVCAMIMCLGISATGRQTTDGNHLYKSVVIDAGSTGTRVHIYNYKIVDEEKGINIHIPSISYRTTPGFVYLLNNYFANDEKVPFYEYFKNIKEFLYEHVKVKERSSTPIIIRASGGFRLLSIPESEKYINFNAMKTYLHYIIHQHNGEEQVEGGKVLTGGEKNSRVVVDSQKNENHKTKFIPVACFPKNFKFYVNNLYETSIEEELHEYDGKMEMSEDDYVAVGTGNIDLCRSQIQTILNYAQIDDLPFKMKRFIKLYGIENFHHFAIDILNLPESFDPIPLNSNMYLEKAKEICPLTIDEIVKVVRPDANIEKAQTSCFGLIFLYEFMRYILKIDEPITFQSTNYEELKSRSIHR
ncbi:nucleoside-diphosphatase mig-23 [Plasmodium cynomolgi strain B]|uniref:Nucleoside-diphosphatase mig-23 n=1 Tax=Plasmodium cynomolgi (strain B) TaxID=1120755 RepID=K6VEZ1_PLACD|nr:nucleoside-diphosphatase mig-23 [Plasmodium cynomolgi strain B]GAB67842.1 nucleoside-diphosphatase mig-23 [Plasmodium cynomolgi strain B]